LITNCGLEDLSIFDELSGAGQQAGRRHTGGYARARDEQAKIRAGKCSDNVQSSKLCVRVDDALDSNVHG
jgi:hypothetical protein